MTSQSVTSVLPRVKDRRVRTYLVTICRPALVLVIAYCFLSSLSFQSSFDGAFSCFRAAELGLVSKQFAASHASDRVLFKHIGHNLYEYRVRRPLLDYAGVPWLVAHQTNRDLAALCDAPGCKLARE